MSKLITEALELAKLLRPSWPEVSQRIAASGHPTCEVAGVVDPLGVDVDGNYVTVADYVNPPTRIPTLVRDLVAANEGYWIEEVFATPGMTVQSGAIIYSDTFPEDHFLSAHGRPGPRAPGSEAPRLAAGRPTLKTSRVESWAGSIEVHDEVRRRNQVWDVQRQFRQAANTFADILQVRGEEVLDAFIDASGREVTAGAGTFADWAAADPIENTASTDNRPAAEFARVRRLFAQDKAGVRPDVLIADPEDIEHLDRVYGDRLDALLRRYGLRLRESTRATVGERIYARSGQVGVMAFEKPLDQEHTREGTRKTDVYTLEATPVYVANGAESVLRVRKT